MTDKTKWVSICGGCGCKLHIRGEKDVRLRPIKIYGQTYDIPFCGGCTISDLRFDVWRGRMRRFAEEHGGIQGSALIVPYFEVCRHGNRVEVCVECDKEVPPDE